MVSAYDKVGNPDLPHHEVATSYLAETLNFLDEQGYEIRKKGAPNLTAITGGVNQVTNGESDE